MQKIGEIKCEIQAAEPGEYATLFEKYKEDTRSGVRKLLEQLHKKEEAYQKELLSTEKMKEFERKYEDLGYVCGIDEVGRGPLAGPVVAGAVILPRDCKILYLNDSKQLSAKKRDELYDVIMENAVAVGIGMASPQRIDEINILQATYEAMRQAIDGLGITPDMLLVDAVTIPNVSIMPRASVLITPGSSSSSSHCVSTSYMDTTSPIGRIGLGMTSVAVNLPIASAASAPALIEDFTAATSPLMNIVTRVDPTFS